MSEPKRTCWWLSHQEEKEGKKMDNHICRMTSFPGGEATPELIDKNFSQLYRKINEIVDAINDIRGSK